MATENGGVGAGAQTVGGGDGTGAHTIRVKVEDMVRIQTTLDVILARLEAVDGATDATVAALGLDVEEIKEVVREPGGAAAGVGQPRNKCEGG